MGSAQCGAQPLEGRQVERLGPDAAVERGARPVQPLPIVLAVHAEQEVGEDVVVALVEFVEMHGSDLDRDRIAGPITRQLAHDRASSWEIRKAALGEGMRTLRQDAWNKVIEGVTYRRVNIRYAPT